MSETPSILVLTTPGSETAVVTPILAALEARGAKLRAFDAGRVGEAGGSAVDWVRRALIGETEERRLEQELASTRPDAVLSFEVATTLALCALRKTSPRPFPVLAVISDLLPSAAWAQCEADRFFVVDDEAAVSLEDHGVTGHAILPVGCIGEYSFVEAGSRRREELRGQFKLSGTVVLVEVAGLGHEQSSQLALQLSLVSGDHCFLFDAGTDTDAAAALRSQVPILGMRAKLFGATDDAPLLWRCADVVVARPKTQAIHRAAAVGASMVCLSPRDGEETRRANALEERGVGATASNALMVGAALGRLLSGSGAALAEAGEDGAAVIADAALLVGAHRKEVVEERISVASASRREDVEDATQYAEWAATAATPAGALEDLGSGGAAPPRPDAAKLRRLLDEIKLRRAQVSRTITDAQKQASSWDAKRAKADKLGNEKMAKTAERNADMERSRMHSALAEMASLDAEEQGLKDAERAAASAPPPASAARSTEPKPSSARRGGTSVHARLTVEEELARMRGATTGEPTARRSKSKSKTGAGKKKSNTSKSGVDDELAALKRKMARKRRG